MTGADEFAVVGFTDVREWGRRLPRLVIGLLCLGSGIAATLRAELGLSPYDVLHQGLAERTGLSFGVVVVLVGTVVNTFTVGFITNGVFDLLPHTQGLVWRWLLLLGGLVVTALGVGIYIGCGLGPGPRDGLMTGLAARGHPVWIVRTLLELTALACGAALGGDVGIGTAVFAFGIGPLGHLFLRRFHLGVDVADPDPDATFAE